ncbi:conserved hypothetical protein [Planktothrix sp. PCC 11201]|uniref:DUF6714 family protein n=1 Tax=Planktothrix sp. PCC 11201 TaxID=1729650 RepID=UPI000910C1FF|nr:DUF6714 family protein [Planktothrix sp. PCC 11201]SKB11889.1 conserved hypothetical protein [Planktothrix sp. PCC 11201]
MESQNSYPCRCCGYLTLTEEPPGTYLICPICFWEDNEDIDNWSIWTGSNQVSLRQAQKNFLEFGACELEWLKDVRSPTVDEARNPNWEPIEVRAEREALLLIEKIRTAFLEVQLEDGITLHEARALDDYRDTEKARIIDCHIHWLDIPDSWIEDFYEAFSFLDAKGFRHYIPAYMIWCLKNYEHTTSASFDSTLYVLERIFKTEDEYYRPKFNILNQVQLEVIQEFMNFMKIYSPG